MIDASLLLTALLLALPADASALTAEPVPEAPAVASLAAGPRLPQVIDGVPPSYPGDALAEGLDGEVLLRVGVTAQGTVAGAEVVQASDPRFEGPAIDAMLGFRFSPAIDAEGALTTALIQYRMVFRAEAALPLSVEGTVRDSEAAITLSSVLVTAEGPEGERLFATTDGEGRFGFVGLADGPWTLEISGGSLYDPKTIELTVSGGVVQQVDAALERPVSQGLDADLTILVEDAASADEVTERVIRADEIEFLPGTSGDVVKAVQNLPGVARAPSGIGQLIIRGTPPEDSQFGLDGSPIPLVFHFSGLTTVLSTENIDEVAYLPGSYGVRYGRALGGYVDLRLDSSLPDEDRSVVSVDVYQTQLYHQRKLGERTAMSVSGRRSYIDAVLSPLLSDGDLTVQAPRYYDGQLRLQHETRRGDSLDALFFMSDDRFRFLGKDADGEDETLAALATSFQKLRLRYLVDAGGDWTFDSSLLLGPESQTFAFARGSEAYEKRFSVALREELRLETDDDRHLGTRLGMDLLCGRDSYLYDVAFYGDREEGAAPFCAPAPYAEITAELGELTVTPGLRGDMLLLPDSRLFALDPRVGLRWVLGEDTTLKAGTGLYSQFPGFRELNAAADGNPDLGAERAWQSSLGLERQLGDQLRAGVTAFYNRLDRLVVGREDRFYFFTGPPIRRDFDTGPYANEGAGMTCGAELLLRYTDDLTVAQLAATFSHSERTGRDGLTQLFEYDQPVILNLLVSRELPRAWRLGTRLRYGSGNPYTPVVNAIQNLDDRSWIPVYDSESYGRLPGFFSLDVRVDKRWTFPRWELTTYLDVQNATFYDNVEIMAYSYDYSEEQPIAGLPVVPSFGLKGVW
jgi:TonB family protein